MRHLHSRVPALGAIFLALSCAQAEDSAANQELREMRQAVQQQAKQIESLAAQIGRLTRLIEEQKAAENPAPSAALEKPGAEPVTEAPRAEPVIRAEMTAGGARHVVAKGETLTSIARQYNIPIAELKNANKIENERKLQIGQILTVPPPKTPETPEKKDNP